MIMNNPKDMVERYHKGIIDVTTRALSQEDFYKLQKDTLQDASALLKTGPVAEADYLIGFIGVTDGDKFGVPAQNAVAHLKRGYKNGQPESGIQLSFVCFGQYPSAPEQFRSKKDGVVILNELGKAGYVHARYELGNFYIQQIMASNNEGKYVPEEWFNRAQKHAQAAADENYSGGHLLLGFMNQYGFSLTMPQNTAAAFIHYTKAFELVGPHYLEIDLRAYVNFNLGGMYFNGEGTARDRRKGLILMTEAADLGNGMAQEWLTANAGLLAKEGLTLENTGDAYDATLIDVDAFTTSGDDNFSEEESRQKARPERRPLGGQTTH
jgi:hypothetical protein